MSASLTPALRNDEAGFRLHRFELYNWGTFHDRIWTIPLDGDNCLLTGEVGSGKSTVVDAITTLLVPSNRAAYNRAAGADAKERSLRSYVEGYYKSERYDDALARPVALRDAGSYSVILGCFRNRATDSIVTLAQIFWMRSGEAQPDRFYAVAERDLSIREHLTGFGDDMTDLRRGLKDAGVSVLLDFKKYRALFVRLLGIRSVQALNLFHQTVSMKSVGNLTNFVRDHMLEPFDAGERIANLISHFDDLTRAHEAIKVAKRQIEHLTPIVKGCEDYAAHSAKSAELAACLDALYTYFARIKYEILEKEGKRLFVEGLEIKGRLADVLDRRQVAQERIEQLDRDIQDNGGNRIALLEQRISAKQEDVKRFKGRCDDYIAKSGALGLPRACDRDSFLGNMKALASMKRDTDDDRRENSETLHGAKIEKRDAEAELASLKAEIESIRASRSNIPGKQIGIRAALSAAMGISEDSLPFIGELLRVKPEERDWEGAAERILHGFGLSLLVPDERYGDVSDWVEKNHLGGRLVYFRVRPLGDVTRRGLERLSLHSLVGKIEIKPDSPFFEWLYAGLLSRFDYACCDDMASFRRESRAVTRAGQIKSNTERHEKDDRSKIDDRSRYILGWDNREKLNLLEGKVRVLVAELKDLAMQISSLTKKDDLLHEQLNQIAALATFADFGEIDWQKPAVDLQILKEELASFIAAAHKLAALKEQADAARGELREIEGQWAETIRTQAVNAKERASTEASLSTLAELLTDAELEKHEAVFASLDTYCSKIIAPATLVLGDCDARQQRCLTLLRRLKDEKEQEAKKVSERTVRTMSAFNQEFPLETQEFDASMESSHEYGEMLLQLEKDDLPRFEAKFKELLNRNTIIEIASLQAQLWNEAEEIEKRIGTINHSLALIDYNEGKYIELEAHKSANQEIRQFQMDLNACTEDVLGGSEGDAYSERKFRSVCEIVEKFKGRAEHSEADRRWTALVTDVRNWFAFSASERWKETGEEYEHYTDSGGKSGGQKEKLAYTVLAAGLAYQFGLDATSARSKTFRFVMIDEAFGRGSNESARFALSLFRALGLQLLVITPMQKHKVIEPYVSRVAFVYIRDGRFSSIRNMSIEEYIALGDAAGNVDKA